MKDWARNTSLSKGGSMIVDNFMEKKSNILMIEASYKVGHKNI